MTKDIKNFLVSTADFALYYNDVLACTGTTNLNTSIEVSMQEQNVNAGKGNKLRYSFKYGRELAVTLESAEWKLEYIAANVGSQITEGLADVYKLGECVQLTNGVGVVGSTPVGDVAVELSNGTIVTVTPKATSIDLTAYGLTDGSVRVTYQYNRIAKSITIDADSSPKVYKLVLDADRHNNKLGKIGSLQIEIPSYIPSGNFTMNFTPDGVASTNIDGKALAVEGDTCADGSSVYAYVKEFDDTATAIQVNEIAATPATISLNISDNKTATISVIGLKGAMYAPIELDNNDCSFVCDTPATATVKKDGTVEAVAKGSAKITVTYDGKTDDVEVTVA